MQLINSTSFKASRATGYDVTGREHAVVIVKATFLIPRYEREEAKVAPEQIDVIPADTFTGEPGFSAPRYETEYCRFKPHCDVLLNGSAHAPKGQPIERATVRLRVGRVNKSFDVVGKRAYRGGIMGLSSTPPEKFTVQPITYDFAFGGTDKTPADPAAHRTYLLNHAGVGYHENTNVQALVGQPLPHTEETGKPINNPRGSYRPMAFGPVGRGWQPRIKWAGTYDQKWLDEVAPFHPKDFDDRYNQAAPEDQQTDYLKGGEEVELINLTPTGRTVFRIPTVEMPVVFLPKNGERIDKMAVCDTLMIEPDLGRFMMVWRTTQPLRKNLLELAEAVVGPMSPAYFRAREMGKMYYPSLAAYISRNKEES